MNDNILKIQSDYDRFYYMLDYDGADNCFYFINKNQVDNLFEDLKMIYHENLKIDL